jgi:hypothetical protein
MAFYMLNLMVLRIPETKHKWESFTCDSLYQTREDVFKKLKNNKNVIDFYEPPLY